MNDEFLTHLIAALKKIYPHVMYVSKRRNSSEREEITFKHILHSVMHN